MPERASKIPHYRTVQEEGEAQPSKNLIAVIDLIEERQIWAKELLVEYGEEPLDFAGKYSIHSASQQVIAALYKLLGIENRAWAASIQTWQKAFKFLLECTEAAGIFVVVNGIVGNNTRRGLDVEEFRGFVLYDSIAPFVFINGKDGVAGRTFTLVHEIVHVLIGKSASFDLSFDKKHHNKIERFCNQIAAEFLVPADLLTTSYQAGKEIKALAKQFKVSQVVVARRLLDVGLISRAQFFIFYKQHKNKVPTVVKKPGGSYYKNVPYRVSQRFFELINTSLKEGKIRPTDAFSLTGLKAKTYDSYLEQLNNS
jgi:Zn-dependent peptidase ImmA (M78 family)